MSISTKSLPPHKQKGILKFAVESTDSGPAASGVYRCARPAEKRVKCSTPSNQDPKVTRFTRLTPETFHPFFTYTNIYSCALWALTQTPTWWSLPSAPITLAITPGHSQLLASGRTGLIDFPWQTPPTAKARAAFRSQSQGSIPQPNAPLPVD